MKEHCGCCEGTEKLTPREKANRPGLDALAYRVGTHAAFLETMKAQLSAHRFDLPLPSGETASARPLLALKTRAASDASIALLDAWATVADVLTFYQERIANEGFLRTATERRSVIELARLVGYKPRPGVAASVFLAYSLDPDSPEVDIPVGSRVQSVPGPREKAQTFETSEPIKARPAWNLLPPRATRPQKIRVGNGRIVLPENDTVFLKGTATKLSVNDPLLIVGGGLRTVFRVLSVEPNAASDRTAVRLTEWVQVPAEPPTTRLVILPAGSSNIRVEGARALDVGDISLSSRMAVSGPGAGEALLKEIGVVRAVVERHLDLESAGVSPTTVTAKSVVEQLESLKATLDTAADATAVREMLDNKVLPQLREVRSHATASWSEKLTGWVNSVVSELEAASRDLKSVGAAASAAPAPSSAEAVSSQRAATGGHAFGGGERQLTTVEIISALAEQLTARASQPPSSSANLGRVPEQSFGAHSDTVARSLVAFNSGLGSLLYAALASAPVNPGRPIQVYALRVKAGLFGAGASPEPQFEPAEITAPGTDVPTRNPNAGRPLPQSQWPEWQPARDEAPALLYLDNVYDQILPQTFAAVLRPDRERPSVFTVRDARKLSRHAYGVNASVTSLRLDGAWWRPRQDPSGPPDPAGRNPFEMIRGTNVFAQAEPLPLAEEPLDEDICGQRITLDKVYDGLEPGRWLIISGERTDVHLPAVARGVERAQADGQLAGGQFEAVGIKEPSAAPAGDLKVGAETAPQAPSEATGEKGPRVEGLPASELVMLSGVEHGYDPARPGDPMLTTIVISSDLAYCYKRGTIKIYGNVVRATHGETRDEILGSGDAARPMQTFEPRESPLTYVSAATPSGVESTLRVRVNDLLWQETESLARLGPTDRGYVTLTDEEDKTTVAFGNGERGVRPPTGVENVRAVYRTGIGRGGNVTAGRITSVVTKPLGVRGVTNPIPATGGADREGRDDVRRHAPLAVLALDRLVSLRDYEDFARTFAGVGRASAARLSDGLRQIVHLTIAGDGDTPIGPTSDLLRNLLSALRAFGDPFQPVRIGTRELLLLFVAAAVRLRPEYLWDAVEPKIRRAALDRFSFARRELGQDVTLSEVVSTIQSVEGVAYVDVEVLNAFSEEQFKTFFGAAQGSPGQYDKAAQRVRVEMARVNQSAADERARILPAQLALLSPAVADTLILSEIKS